MKRASLLAVPFLAALVASLAVAAPQQPEALATALISRVAQPGVSDQVSLSLAAPPPAAQNLAGYAYPGDGSIVRIGSADARVTAQPGVSSSAQSGVTALGFTNALYADVDGNPGFDAPLAP